MNPLADRHRVLFVHAHPDDETLATGAAIASLCAAGVRVHVLTATRGERGEVVPGPLSRLEGTPALREHREGELARALAALGSPEHHYLGSGRARAAGLPEREYEDSGMSWAPDGLAVAAPDTGPGAFTRADPAAALADLDALVASIDPDLIVSYAEDGGYGHPDHRLAHALALASARRAGVDFAEVLSPDPEEGEEPGAAAAFVLDARPWVPQIWAALDAHGTQLRREGDRVTHSGGQTQRVAVRERYRILPADTVVSGAALPGPSASARGGAHPIP